MSSREFLEKSFGPSIVERLSSLGDTASEIANHLAAAGFKGTRGSSEDDPLAHFLAEAFRAQPELRFFISDVGATVSDGGPWCVELPVSAQVSEFVRELDAGLHKNLERDPNLVCELDDFVFEHGVTSRPSLRVVAEQR